MISKVDYIANNSKPKIVITGAAGIIGTILQKGLNKYYSILALDIAYKNSTDKNKIYCDVFRDDLTKYLKGSSAVIHLAWNNEENYLRGYNPINRKGSKRIFDEAARLKVPRFILASSVNAMAGYWHHEPPVITKELKKRKIKVDDKYWPVVPYGESKIQLEKKGKECSDKYKMKVVCLRFGACHNDNKVPKDDAFGLRKRDLVDIVSRSLKYEKRYGIFYGVTRDVIFDLSNARKELGYNPK